MGQAVCWMLTLAYSTPGSFRCIGQVGSVYNMTYGNSMNEYMHACICMYIHVCLYVCMWKFEVAVLSWLGMWCLDCEWVSIAPETPAKRRPSSFPSTWACTHISITSTATLAWVIVSFLPRHTYIHTYIGNFHFSCTSASPHGWAAGYFLINGSKDKVN